MQVQYSLLDDRPEHGLVALCRDNNVHLLCYGSVAGGFLSDSWFGRPEPRLPLENRSLTKYKLIIDDFGGWDVCSICCACCERLPTGTASTSPPWRAGPCWIVRRSLPSSSAPATRAISPAIWPSCVRLTPADHAEIERCSCGRRQGPEGRCLRSRARPHRAARRDHEIQPQSPGGPMTPLLASAHDGGRARCTQAFEDLFTGRSRRSRPLRRGPGAWISRWWRPMDQWSNRDGSSRAASRRRCRRPDLRITSCGLNPGMGGRKFGLAPIY